MELISIIIPSFNKANYISDTLDSLLSQGYPNWEAIIVDDGSTDESINIVQKYCEKDIRFHLIKRERMPKGGSSCRNIGLNQVKGAYTLFLDADDLLAPHCLSGRLTHFRLYTDFDFLVFSGGTFFYKIGDSTSQWIPKPGEHLKQFLAHTLPWNISLPIWKTSFLKELGGFNEAYPRLQDVELHTRALLQKGVKYMLIGGEPDFYYRIDEGRKLKSPYQFVETFIKAVELYTGEMPQLIKQRNDSQPLLKTLNGTNQAAYLTAQLQYDLGNITIAERNKLFEQIETFHHPKGLFKAYIKGLQMGVHKLKGYNWLMKRILIS